MARPRQFNETDVRQAVLGAFWQNGFGSTSLNDLEKATGLGRRSLYNSFGDKHALFVRALQDFRAVAVRRNLAAVDDPAAGVEGIDAVLKGLVELAGTPEGRNGCLVCNTAREPVVSEKDVRAEVDGYFGDIEERFLVALRASQERGDIPPSEDIKSLAQFYLGVLVSICVMARAGAPFSVLDNIRKESLRRLGS